MDAKEIMQASQLDILFDGRNKAYGAYALRKNYNRRIKAAMAGTGLMVLLFVGASRLPRKKAPDPVIMIDPIPVHLTKLSSRPVPPKAPPPAPPGLLPDWKCKGSPFPVWSMTNWCRRMKNRPGRPTLSGWDL